MDLKELSVSRLQQINSNDRRVLHGRVMLRSLGLLLQSVAKHKVDRNGQEYSDRGQLSLMACNILSQALLPTYKLRSQTIYAPIRTKSYDGDGQKIKNNGLFVALKNKSFRFSYQLSEFYGIVEFSMQNKSKPGLTGITQFQSTHQQKGLPEFLHDLSLEKPSNLVSISLWHSKKMTSRNPFKTIDYYSKNNIWSYWCDWYQGLLEGKPIDWDIQNAIIAIPKSDWDKGPAHIAGMIEEIQARFLIEKTAFSEKIDFNVEAQQFYATPTPIFNPRLLSTNLTLVSDALDEAMQGNGLRPDCWEDRILRKTLESFADDPERVEMDCMRVHRRLTAKLGNELPESDELVDLTATLLDVALDIRANHPEVAENRAKRGAQAFREASADEKALLKEAIPHIRTITDANLGQQIEDDIEEILEGSDLTAPEGLAVAVDPVARTGSRLAKISLALVKGGALVTGGVFAIAGGVVAIDAAIPILKLTWPIFLKLLGY